MTYEEVMEELEDLGELLGGLAYHADTENRKIVLRYALRNILSAADTVTSFIGAQYYDSCESSEGSE